jgi:hypothetical protein
MNKINNCQYTLPLYMEGNVEEFKDQKYIQAAKENDFLATSITVEGHWIKDLFLPYFLIESKTMITHIFSALVPTSLNTKGNYFYFYERELLSLCLDYSPSCVLHLLNGGDKEKTIAKEYEWKRLYDKQLANKKLTVYPDTIFDCDIVHRFLELFYDKTKQYRVIFLMNGEWSNYTYPIRILYKKYGVRNIVVYIMRSAGRCNRFKLRMLDLRNNDNIIIKEYPLIPEDSREADEKYLKLKRTPCPVCGERANYTSPSECTIKYDKDTKHNCFRCSSKWYRDINGKLKIEGWLI